MSFAALRFHYECVRVTAEECSQPDFDFICTSCKIRRKAAQDKADKDDEVIMRNSSVASVQ